MIALNKVSWPDIGESLNAKGYGIIPHFFSSEDCFAFTSRYNEEALYRSTIDMKRYRFGQGEYKYYNYPLPSVIQGVRENLYPHLAKIANTWMTSLSINQIFPQHHKELLEQCQAKQQLRPTPLILHYQEGGFNTLHQDLYGEVYFPFQVVFLLSRPGIDFEGGEFILVEQLPRAQSRAEVIQLNHGDALIFTTNFRPVLGNNGYYRAKMKHGISRVQKGERYAMGVIFHDAA